jgi:hypothetical protein
MSGRKPLLTGRMVAVVLGLFFLALLLVACGDSDEEAARVEYQSSSSSSAQESVPDADYLRPAGGSPELESGTEVNGSTDGTGGYSNPGRGESEKNIIAVEIIRNTVYVDGLGFERDQLDEAVERLQSLRFETNGLIELNLVRSKAGTSERFQRLARSRGIYFNRIVME